MTGLTIADVARKYGVRRRVISELVRTRFVLPRRGRRREYRFAFRDVVLMRMAQDLYDRGIPPRKTARFLQQLRQELPDEAFGGLRVAAAGRELVVRQDGRLRNVAGQLVIDFDEHGQAALMPFPEPAMRPHAGIGAAADWHAEAVALERTSPLDAARCYREAISADAFFTAAYVNLGCLLLQQGQVLEARIVLEEGIAVCGGDALLYFNLGIAFEDAGLRAAAVKSYEKALDCDPSLADAHFNLARLHEEAGHAARAIRHFNAYRRLENL